MIALKPLVHRGQSCTAIVGKLTAQVHSIIRGFSACKYSKTHSCYYFADDNAFRDKLVKALSAVENVVDSLNKPVQDSSRAPESLVPRIYIETLTKKRYSAASCRTYVSQFDNFLKFIAPKQASEISDEDVHRYLVFLVSEKKVSLSTQNQAINSIKFYLEHVERNEQKRYYIDRPRKEIKLPTVLSEEEVWRLIKLTKNRKHRCLVLLLYSSGLRISELLGLKAGDIDRDRKVVHIHGGKGRKDRITILSDKVVLELDKYLAAYEPGFLLFEGRGGKPYSERSVNKIIKRSAGLAGINKNISAHTLRHTFATHLLEHGTDIRYIQALLGHESSKTTERYTHVTRRGFEQLRSPFDRISENSNFDDNSGLSDIDA